MALLTALDIAQRAMDEVGLPRPQSLLGSSQPLSLQLLALMNTGAKEIMRAHDWGELITLALVSTIAGQSDYAVPVDYHRMVPTTQWDRSNIRPMRGPITPQRERFEIERGINAGIPREFRQIGSNAIRITPVPGDTGAILTYDYVSKYWAVAGTGASTPGITQPEYANDTDTTVFEPDLLVKDLSWRFFMKKGWDSDALKLERDSVFYQQTSANIGSSTLSLSRRRRTYSGDVIAGTSPDVIITDNGDYLGWD